MGSTERFLAGKSTVGDVSRPEIRRSAQRGIKEGFRAQDEDLSLGAPQNDGLDQDILRKRLGDYSEVPSVLSECDELIAISQAAREPLTAENDSSSIINHESKINNHQCGVLTFEQGMKTDQTRNRLNR